MIPSIIIDVNGGDNSPNALVEGAVLSLHNKGFEVVLLGGQQAIERELSKYIYAKERLHIVDAIDIVYNTDKPTDVVRAKKDSSMIKGLTMLRDTNSCIGMVSVGNTGAYLAGGTFVVGRLQGVLRPSLSALVPTIGGRKVCICDAGANVDSKPEYINQYAILASCYVRAFVDIDNPRVGLLNNGVEETKGNDTLKLAHKLLSDNQHINFVGNIEARYALDDIVDVIVADGLLGNVLLKSIEGTAISMFKMLKKNIMQSGISGKIGALLLKKAFGKLRRHMDYQSVGGAPLLGLNKIVLKAHGSSQAVSIAQSVWDIKKMHDEHMIDNIKELIAHERSK
ncbi:MAG: phosphate acyltransferase PlsX [Clostridiales bacterium]|jgi:glycerol-3-phosphate acyltransferase PlsX|nr:phosphate acyltransferase PlsX [Clostridiales bacterium]